MDFQSRHLPCIHYIVPSSYTSYTIHQSLDLPSDHAALSLVIDMDKKSHARTIITDDMTERSRPLGRVSTNDQTPLLRRPMHMRDTYVERAKALLQEIQSPTDTADMNLALQELDSRLYAQARDARRTITLKIDKKQRRQRLIDDSDQCQLWQAINWKGDIQSNAFEEKDPVMNPSNVTLELCSTPITHLMPSPCRAAFIQCICQSLMIPLEQRKWSRPLDP